MLLLVTHRWNRRGLYVCTLSVYRHTEFPDFSWLCFHIFVWNLVHMTSFASSSTFVTVDLLFHELLPFKIRYPDFWMKLGSKLFVSKITVQVWLLSRLTCFFRSCSPFSNTLSILVAFAFMPKEQTVLASREITVNAAELSLSLNLFSLVHLQ